MKTIHWSDALLKAMINADHSGAAQIIEQALAAGTEPHHVIADILDPAIVRLGTLTGADRV